MKTKSSSLKLLTLLRSTALGGCGLCMLMPAASAVERTFSATGTGTKLWSDGSYWDGGEAPTDGDDLYFSRGGSASQASTNDLPDWTTIRNITLEGTRQMTISGNAIILSGNYINNTTNQQITLGISVQLTAGDHIVHTNSSHSNGTTLGGSGTVIGGPGGLVKTGTGIFRIYGSNTFSGGLTINEGIVRAMSGGTVLGTGTVTLAAGTTLDITQNIDVTAINGAGTIGNFSATDARRLTINGNSHSIFSGTIMDGGETLRFHLTAAGSGTLTLTGTSTYTGVTQIQNGHTLEVYSLKNGGEASSIGQSGTASGNLIIDGGTLRYLGTGDATDRNFQIGVVGGSLEATIDASGSGALVFTSTAAFGYSATNNVPLKLTLAGTNTDDNLLSGVLIDRGAGKSQLFKTGEGTWVLTGSHSYTGGTEIEAGTLRLAGGNNRLSQTGAILLKGGTLDLGGNSQTTSGDIILQAGSIVNGTLVKTTGSYMLQSGTISAQLTGNAGLTKATEGVAVLEGNHTYTGPTLLNEGTLIVNGGIATDVTIASGARLAGHGTVAALGGEGTVGGAGAPGILTAASVDGSEGLSFTFRLTQAGAPVFTQSDASGNDLLRLTAANPFTEALGSASQITFDFTGVAVSGGMEFLGGFYADQADFTGDITNAEIIYLGLDGYTVELSVIPYEADFGGGPVHGYITHLQVIPEPAALTALGALGTLVLCQRRKRTR